MKKSHQRIPASMAVRKGYRAEAEQPLPEGVKSKRQSRRVPVLFDVMVGSEWKHVSGDISAGGALVLSDDALPSDEVQLSVELADGSRKWTAKAEVLKVELRGRRYAHHLRFVDTAQVDGLDAAIREHLEKGGILRETI